MSEPTAQEPTMEEILASIRRIISEDDAPAETAAAPAPEPAPEPTPFPAAAAESAPEPEVVEPEAVEDDILELTDTYEAPPVESIGDLDVSTPEPEAKPWNPTEPEPAKSYDSLVGESAAASAASAFAGLHASLKKPEPAPAPSGDLNFISGSTVEGMVAEMLKPLLKNWLDTNLPGIVEKAVQAEVERIARTAG